MQLEESLCDFPGPERNSKIESEKSIVGKLTTRVKRAVSINSKRPSELRNSMGGSAEDTKREVSNNSSGSVGAKNRLASESEFAITSNSLCTEEGSKVCL
jgi:hypothetical protein